jgi:mannose-6-phosphate isomerase
VPVTRLRARAVERVWGRRRLPGGFAGLATGSAPIGEIWHEREGGAACGLLVKHLFTSDRLSIQVHPDDAAARTRGHACGKDEAWLVLDAEPGAVIGLGLTREVSRDALRAAALDGSIEQMIDLKPVNAGDFFYSPAGTIHAIGAGLTLVEIQQNLDLTYRLYDYGRPRELHLADALAVAWPAPWSPISAAREAGGSTTVLAEQGRFVVERLALAGAATLDAGDREMVAVVIDGQGDADGERFESGAVLGVSGRGRIEAVAGAVLLMAYPGGKWREDAVRA